MCTITMHRGSGTLLVTMNRDELRARAPEAPPRLATEAGVRWAAPIDTKSGGTWMGVNDRGLVACLLNAYANDEMPQGLQTQRSRGHIVPKVLQYRTVDEAQRFIATEMDMSVYPAFHLVVAGPEKGLFYTWRDSQLAFQDVDEPWWMWSTSSWNTEEVLAFRRSRFEAWLAEGAPSRGLLPSLHTLQSEAYAKYTPLMDRELTATRSITQACVRPRVELRYWPRRPGQGIESDPASVVVVNEGLA